MSVFRLCFVPFLEISSPPTLGGPHPMVRARARARENRNVKMPLWHGGRDCGCAPGWHRHTVHLTIRMPPFCPCKTACLTAGTFTAQLGNGHLASQFAGTRNVNRCRLRRRAETPPAAGQSAEVSYIHSFTSLRKVRVSNDMFIVSGGFHGSAASQKPETRSP
jgi:hypothetical protein